MYCNIGHSLIIDVQQLRFFPRSILAAVDAECLHVLDGVDGGCTVPGKAHHSTQPSQEPDQEQVQMVACTLLELVFWFVHQEEGELILYEYQDTQLGGGEEGRGVGKGGGVRGEGGEERESGKASSACVPAYQRCRHRCSNDLPN